MFSSPKCPLQAKVLTGEEHNLTRFFQVFAGHESKVSCVMFTTSGKAVISGSDDATVRVWAPRTGECRHTFSGHGFHVGAVTCLAR